jgi:4-hydroxy-2-oxoheptanedioate aldolase
MEPSSTCRPSVYTAAIAAAALIALARAPSAQQPYVHINPVIAKLSKGQVPFGIQTSDISFENARALARAPIDYVVIDFEHTPLDLKQIQIFMAGMLDRSALVNKKGSNQHDIAVMIEFPAYSYEQVHWLIKQALDIGVMGVQFSDLETKEQALGFVRMMRFVRPRSDRLFAPPGLRLGGGAGLSGWFWGVTQEEYQLHADVWPLNPQGELIAWPIVETALGVQNADEIAQVPGISGLSLTSGGDLSRSMGVPRGDPSVEAAHLSVLKVCEARKIICGGRVTQANVAKWAKAGYRFLNVGEAGGLTPDAEATLRAGRALVAADRTP